MNPKRDEQRERDFILAGQRLAGMEHDERYTESILRRLRSRGGGEYDDNQFLNPDVDPAREAQEEVEDAPAWSALEYERRLHYDGECPGALALEGAIGYLTLANRLFRLYREGAHDGPEIRALLAHLPGWQQQGVGDGG